MDLETFIPGLREARSAEKLHRGLCFAGLTYSLCGEQVNAITPQVRLELQLLGNAFVTESGQPTEVDAFELVWLLNKHRKSAFGFWRKRQLKRRLLRLGVAAVVECCEFLISQMQDAGDDRGNDNGRDMTPWIHWMAMEAEFWIQIHGGFTLESYRQTPYLVLQQLRRAYQCNHPEITRNRDGSASAVEPSFFNRSDRLVSQWHSQLREAAAEKIRQNTVRRDD